VAVRLVLVAYLGFLYRPSKPIFVNQAMRLPLSQHLNAQSVTERPSQHFKTDVLARRQVVAARENVEGGCFALTAAQRGDWSADFFTTERYKTTFSPTGTNNFSPVVLYTRGFPGRRKLDCIFVKGYLQKERKQ
jgi:hypothetical protein